METNLTIAMTDVDPSSWEIRQAFLIAFVLTCAFLTVFGMVGNAVNIVVFVKQGFKDSTNISLLALAVADFGCLLTMLWSTLCLNPLIVTTGALFASLDVMYITGGWPHLLFNRITSFITAFITLERCLCVTMPMKVKSIMTQTRTRIIIVCIFLILITIFSPIWYVNKLVWGFNSLLNTSTLILVYTDDREIVESVTFLIHSVFMSTICLFVVLVCTVILVVKITITAKWRKTSASVARNNTETASVRDKKVVKMITFISIIFVVCFVPGTAIFLTMACYPQVSIGGRYENTFVIVWCVGFILETLNSSVNIIIYLKMSSKFKVTFVETFCGCRKADITF